GPVESEIYYRLLAANGFQRNRKIIDHAAQPSWSPHGQRIAYWGVLPKTGRRAIWTRSVASPQEEIPVVDDGYLNWNPACSPDGRYVYFASDRSGIMNLWRVPIDEETGRERGKPEPVTTSQQACMLPSLSRGGRQIAYSGDKPRAALEKVSFDHVTGEV